MRPTFAKGNRIAISKLLELRRQAQRDKEPRVVLRIQGILMSLEGGTAGEISNHLKVHRSTVPRPRGLSPEDREKLCDILDSGPTAYGLETGIWTSPRVRQVIAEEFGQQYHPGHVRKLLQQLGYSVRRPSTRLVQADLKQHRKWVRYTYPNLQKTPKAKAR
jgi:hypothetical protein